MSKINTLRIINLNYNNNSIRIGDEIFHMNGESTLLSLRNGGGKTVLVQMMTAPFVHKRYRDTKDRKFESYFTTNKPSFIMVEWLLDGGAGYVLTGMMIRKNQDVVEGEVKDELEIYNFISEYRERCDEDIFHLPVVEKTDTGMKLKGWGVCKKILEDLKKENSNFFLYSMNQSAQSRMYFEKLKEYRINNREWEGIIKKVNMKESGLSELFSDCRDEKGLVDKWFLDAIENKLNKDSNRISEFQNIVIKYIRQYRKNRTNIDRLKTVKLFQELSFLLLGQCEQYRDNTKKREGFEKRIASFRFILEALCERAKERKNEINGQIHVIEQNLRQVSSEKISYEIYRNKDQKEYHARDREQFVLEKSQLERDEDKLERERRMVECAGIRHEMMEALSECKHIESRLAVSKQDEKENEPKRQRIGGKIYKHYCFMQSEVSGEIDGCLEKLRQLSEDEEKWRERQDNYQRELTDKSADIGGLNAKISSYDSDEENFCKKYGISIARNILGEYEEESLEIERLRERKLLDDANKSYGDFIREREENEETLRKLEHELESTGDALELSRMRLKEKEQLLAEYDRQLEERRIILKYIGFGEDKLYKKESIEKELKAKMDDIDCTRIKLEREYEQMENVCVNLKKGRIMELPADFEEYLESIEITPIYGMDWLLRNGHSTDKNRELVNRQPFLPYSVILTRKDMDKLKSVNPEIYTDSPIPMIVREELETVSECVGSGICTLGNVNFYLKFREDFLSSEGRKKLLELQQAKMSKKKNEIDRRKEEYASYFSKYEKIKNQSVTEKKYLECNEIIEDEYKKQKGYGKKITEAEIEKNNLRKRAKEIETEILNISNERYKIQTMFEDFASLTDKYNNYLKNRNALEKLKENISNLNRQIQNAKEKLDEIKSGIIGEERKQIKLNNMKKSIMEKLSTYKSFAGGEDENEDYDELEKYKVSGDELIELEASYEALTSGISQEIKLLEEQLGRADARYQKKDSELNKLLARYGYTSDDIKTEYSRELLFELEEQLKRKRGSISDYEKKINKTDTKIAVYASKIEEGYLKLEQTLGIREPVAREKITNLEFDARSQEFLVEKQKFLEESDVLSHRINNYEANVDSLSEYEEFPADEDLPPEENFAKMSESDINKFKATLLRDYKICINGEMESREGVLNRLNEMARMGEFSEEFFAKPLSTLFSLVGKADDLIKQLTIVRASYESMTEKLEVDISVIEKERERILETLTDHVKEIHDNLAKIDKNSTIQVRGRSIKMLTIRLPEWEENEELYRTRIQDMLDDVTKQGMEYLDENKNIDELVGIYINTNNLYDTVVGNGNIEIRLYKIEEQKEYPISWSDVSKNSGGEGFLSAFIVLTSLLYYMRRDDTDIFADRNEGKVLVMDNPFAQTNAAHLLKPLMDMAKKTNTQLICLSGLGGDSIYNRFDNIYVLNLIAANLRSGTQYLQSEHLLGDEPETMISARIHVEQQTLLF